MKKGGTGPPLAQTLVRPLYCGDDLCGLDVLAGLVLVEGADGRRLADRRRVHDSGGPVFGCESSPTARAGSDIRPQLGDECVANRALPGDFPIRPGRPFGVAEQRQDGPPFVLVGAAKAMLLVGADAQLLVPREARYSIGESNRIGYSTTSVTGLVTNTF